MPLQQNGRIDTVNSFFEIIFIQQIIKVTILQSLFVMPVSYIKPNAKYKAQ